MISDYIGIFDYDDLSVRRNAPIVMGVYYCGIREENKLFVNYVGRAKGESISIRSRLLDHLRIDPWDNVTHFGYRICTTKKEAEILEAQEIYRLQPINNKIGKLLPSY